MGLVKDELLEYYDYAVILHQWNYYASAWHILLYTVSCWAGSDNWTWRIILSVFSAIYILNIVGRACLYGDEQKEIWKNTSIRGTTIYLGILGTSFVLTGLSGIYLASSFNNPNILPIALSTSHSGASLNNTTFNNPTCKGGSINYIDFRDWMDCLRDQYNCNTDACVAYNVDPDAYEILGNTTDIQFVLRKGTTDVFSDGMYVWWGVSLFSIITAGFHAILAISADDVTDTMSNIINRGIYPIDERRRRLKEPYNRGPYKLPELKWWISVPYVNWIWNGIQPMRWAEYSITASLMIVLVFIINGVTDIYLLAFSYIIMNLVNSFGAAIDYVNEQAIVAWFWACGVGAIIWQFALLLAAYSENITPYMEADTKDLWQQYFGFIPWMNWLVIISFSGFGITNIVHQYLRFKGCCMLPTRKVIRDELKENPVEWKSRCCCCITNKIASAEKQRKLMAEFEIIYIIQSFVSKTILVACVLAGSVQRL